MKKLLLPFIVLFSTPFNTSCIHEITFDVTINASNCQYEIPKEKAVFGQNYIVNITSIDPDYVLEQSVDFFWIKTAKFDPIYPPPEGEKEGGQWTYEDNRLLIRGSVVTSSLDIQITARPKYE